MSLIFPFLHQSRCAEEIWSSVPPSSIQWSKYECICGICGKSRFETEIPEEEWEFSLHWKCRGMPEELPDVFLCKECAIYFFKFHKTFEDLEALNMSVNYLERSILCRKRFLKTQVKSKQQDSLERSLSMRQKECLTGTWT